MPTHYSKWALPTITQLLLKLPLLKLLLLKQADGLVLAVMQVTQETSVKNAVLRSLLNPDGPAHAVPLTKANSVQTAELKSLPVHLFISVISADGSRKILRILQNSVRNAEIHLMTEM